MNFAKLRMEKYDFGAFGKFSKNAIDGKKCKKKKKKCKKNPRKITQSRILPIPNLKGKSVVAAILPSRMEVSYCTSGFFRS